MFNQIASFVFGILLAVCGVSVFKDPLKFFALLGFFAMCLHLSPVLTSKIGGGSGD